MKRLLFFALALAACSDPVEPVSPTLAAGLYSLVTVNGKSLPIAMGNSFGDSLRYSHVTVTTDQSFTEESVTGPIIGHASGKVVYRADGFQFWANGDSSQTMFSQGTLEGQSLTVNFYGVTRVYQKQ